jgi:hypothetical protein
LLTTVLQRVPRQLRVQELAPLQAPASVLRVLQGLQQVLLASLSVAASSPTFAHCRRW